MKKFSFGQREESLIQVAYTVDDIERRMREYTEFMHIGPWFLVGPFVPARGVYRGRETRVRLSLGVAFAGEIMLELIQQHDDQPSVYREMLETRGGHGFHHWAIGTREFEEKVAHYRWLGYPEVFSDVSPRGGRIAYFDTRADLPGMLEVIEVNAAVEAQYREMHKAAQAWNGINHVVHRQRSRRPAEHGGRSSPPPS